MRRKIESKTNRKLKEKGITLTALVVTIIILLILATITIRAITGDNGIIRRTSEAVDAYKIAENKEQETLEYLYGELNPNQEITITMEALNDLIDKKVNEKVEEKIEEKVNQKLEEDVIKRKLYPIGSIFITTTDTNPSELLGGTWESYGEGRTLIGAGTGIDTNNTTKVFTANTTGGEYNHKLTISEMPKHFHKGLYYGHPKDNLELTLDQGTKSGYKLQYYGAGVPSSVSSGVSNYTGYEGESQLHNNIQPYIVTYMWKRVS